MALIDKAREALANDREISAQASALLEYANGVTGAADTRLGDAVRTLGEGYGGGDPLVERGFEFEFETDVTLESSASGTLFNSTIPGIPAFDRERWFLLVVRRISEDPGYVFNTGKVLVGRVEGGVLNATGGTMLASDGKSFVFGTNSAYGINVKITAAGLVTVSARAYTNVGKILSGRYRVSVSYFDPFSI